MLAAMFVSVAQRVDYVYEKVEAIVVFVGYIDGFESTRLPFP